MIADDSALNTELMRKQFKNHGYEDFTFYCQNGLELLNLTKEIVTKDLLRCKYFPVMPISLIIIDINMPVKDGLTAMSEIKEFYA